MKNTTYINNKFVDHNKAKISVDDRGFLFADSVYELISVLNKKIIDLDQHLNRLKVSLRKVKIKYKLNKKKFEETINKLIKINNIFNGYIYTNYKRSR